MLSIKSQKSPKEEARYYREHLAHDDYYSDKRKTHGYWFGQTCGMLGLDTQEPVQQKDFVALCKGLRPVDGTRLTQRTSATDYESWWFRAPLPA